MELGLGLTRSAISHQLATMPHEVYLVRLIHQPSGRPLPGQRRWTASQLLDPPTVRFLRIRNREGFDIYLRPYSGDQNAGYILVDLDRADAGVIGRLRSGGHAPCLVVETSPGHLQAWIQISRSPVEPTLATAIARHLAHGYHGDTASADWAHLGRLAGFTNQKPARRLSSGQAPWVRIIHAQPGVAPVVPGWLQAVRPLALPVLPPIPASAIPPAARDAITPAAAARIYQDCVRRWRIAERFPRTDWSIVDLWVARYLRGRGTSALRIQAIVRLGSPGFPRRHGDADDYLRRTLARTAFPPAGGPV